MNAPSTLYSAQNPEIAFANVCKREGIQDSRFKIQDLRFKILNFVLSTVWKEHS